MIKTFFMAWAYFYVSLFASAPLTDKEDVDQYITRLKAALPGRAEHDCFFNLCDYASDDKDLNFPCEVYYFVDNQYIAEYPKKALEAEFGYSFWGDLKGCFRDFFRDKWKFLEDYSEVPKREIALRGGLPCLYKREPFLKALNEPVVVYDSLDLLSQYAELLTTFGMRAFPSLGDLDVTRPVAPVTQQRVTRASKDPRAQAAAENAKKKLDARRAAQNVPVPTPPPVSVVVEEVKPASSATAAVIAKDKEKRRRKRKGTRGNSAAVAPLGLKLVSTSVDAKSTDAIAGSDGDIVMNTKPSPGTAPTIVTADSDGDVVMKIKPSPQDLKLTLMEEDSAEEGPRYLLAAVLPQVLTPYAINIKEIVKGLTSTQLADLDAEYAGRGFTSYEEKYTQACEDNFFSTFRSTTPAHFAARSVSRPKARVDDAVRAPTPSRSTSRMRRPSDADDAVRLPTPSRATSRMRVDSAVEDEVMRSMPPPFIVKYDSVAVQKQYKEFFKQPQNACAKEKWNELKRNISFGHCHYYPGFASIDKAKKVDIGDGKRVVFKVEETEEGRVVTFYSNPKHYGD